MGLTIKIGVDKNHGDVCGNCRHLHDNSIEVMDKRKMFQKYKNIKTVTKRFLICRCLPESKVLEEYELWQHTCSLFKRKQYTNI